MDRYAARKSEAVIRLTDGKGQVLAGKTVRAELVKHEFLFGTGAFFTTEIDNESVPERRRRTCEEVWNTWRGIFNYATLPFYFGRYEPVRGKTQFKSTEKAVSMLERAGKSVKGHPLCWHTVVPDWMYGMSAEETLDYVLMRIERDAGGFRGRIGYWDVINETVIMPSFTNEPEGKPCMNPITNLCREMGRIKLVKTLFDAAHNADKDAVLLINDFVTGDEYYNLIRDYLDAGVPIGAIGIQSHQHQGTWGAEKLAAVTERYERLGLPIHFTENTILSGHLMPKEIVDLNDYKVSQWPSTPEGEEYQKTELSAMMEYLFARPLVKAFTTWDFEDHGWLLAPAGLIRSDGSEKPALTWIKNKLADDWHTGVTITTDANGIARFTGFRGEYSLKTEGASARFTLSECPGELNITLK